MGSGFPSLCGRLDQAPLPKPFFDGNTEEFGSSPPSVFPPLFHDLRDVIFMLCVAICIQTDPLALRSHVRGKVTGEKPFLNIFAQPWSKDLEQYVVHLVVSHRPGNWSLSQARPPTFEGVFPVPPLQSFFRNPLFDAPAKWLDFYPCPSSFKTILRLYESLLTRLPSPFRS